MNFTKFDVSILLVMSLAVIVMSFTFPALGLAEESVNESEIPDYNASANSFDIAGEFPSQPNTATSGELTYDQQQGNSIAGVNLVWLSRPKDTGASLELQNTSQDGFDVVFVNYTDTGATSYDYNITGQEGQEILIQEADWVIQVEITSVDNYNEPNMTAAAEWNIESDPDSSSGVSSIPIIGGLADALANIVGFIAVVITWIVFTIIEVIVSGVIALFTVVQYLFGMSYWLISTYTAIVSTAPGWASIVLTIPAILLFAEFAKITLIAISLFPTT